MTSIRRAGSPRETEQALRARCEQLEAILSASTETNAAFLRQVLDINPHFIFAKDRAGRFTLVNKAVAEAYGTTVEDLIGKSDADFNPNSDEVAHFRLDDLEVMDRLQEKFVAAEVITDASGRVRWLQTIKRPIVGPHGKADQILGVSTDITRHRQLEDQLARAALHDSLTELPNRALFRDRLSMAIERARAQGAHGFAVLFIDLDRFKMVNDGLGHAVGDQLLVEVAHRLRRCVPAGDTLARLGGDEFTMLLAVTGQPCEPVAVAVAERVRAELLAPFVLDGREIYVGASIGIALSDAADLDADAILRNADTALYRAKASGRGSHVVFSPTMQALVLSQLELQSDLRRALDRRQLSLAFQPIHSLETGRLVEVEALLRWVHPERGSIDPADFLPLAVETGCMLRIEEWLLEEACRTLAGFAKLGLAEPLGLSLNLASSLMGIGNPVDRILGAARAAGADPRHLRVEITETTVMQHVDTVAGMLRRLRETGVHVDIDDFGTGYSSLSYLHRLPLDRLKVDRSFVQRIDDDGDGHVIAKTIVALAHALGLEVVAEGVETASQLERVRAVGCTHVQGFLISQPLTLEELRVAAVAAVVPPCLSAPSDRDGVARGAARVQRERPVV